MQEESFHFTPVYYLAGFHLHKPDYNFNSIKGELFNKISEITGRVFEILPLLENLYILRNSEFPSFEIKFGETVLNYQDSIEYEDFKQNAFKILESWQTLNNKARILRLVGVLRKIKLTDDAPKGIYNSRLYEKYLKNFKINDKKIKLKLHLNYIYNRKNLDYNINLNFDEIMKKDYSYEVKLDINKIDSDNKRNIDYKKAQEIFDFAEQYYNAEFKTDIGL